MENNKSVELEEMRTQLDNLKRQLDQQEIVNEKLMITSMKGKMSWIKKYVYAEIIALPFILLMLLPLYFALNVSLYSLLFVIVLCVIDVYFDYRINVQSISPADYEQNNLLQTAQKLVEMKKLRSWQTAIGLLLVSVWVVWLAVSIKNSTPVVQNDFMHGFVHGGAIGAVVGGVLGVIIAFFVYRKMQKTNDQIIAQIEEMTKE